MLQYTSKNLNLHSVYGNMHNNRVCYSNFQVWHKKCALNAISDNVAYNISTIVYVLQNWDHLKVAHQSALKLLTKINIIFLILTYIN